MTDLNRYLDAAVLKPELTRQEATDQIQLCLSLNTRTVCVRPCDIALAQRLCAGSQTSVGVVLAFPHGLQLPASKADEARRYADAGVAEIDMVANYGFARSAMWSDVLSDIAAVTAVTRPARIPLKVIFETAHLDLATTAKLTEICIEAGADFVKTSTGFNGQGARPDHIQTMLDVAAGRIKIKASGGIRDAATAQMYIDMGVHRLGVGATSCAAICQGTPSDSNTTY